MAPITPATPAQAATPGQTPQAVTTPPASTEDQGAKVTIPIEEYRNLQRSDARVRALQRRGSPGVNPETIVVPDANTDPDVAKQMNDLKFGKEAAEKKALQLEVRGRVRDLLDKDEYKTLPKSTRDLILKNPAMLSSASNLEEAMFDIEDFLIEQVTAIAPAPTDSKGAQPAGHETPVVTPNTPAKVDAAGLEDLTKLTGPARSQAAIRNAIKGARGVTKV